MNPRQFYDENQNAILAGGLAATGVGLPAAIALAALRSGATGTDFIGGTSVGEAADGLADATGLSDGSLANKIKNEMGMKQTPPSLAPLQQTVTPEQLAASQGGVNNALGGQAGLLAALRGRGGMGYQTSAAGGLGNLAGGLAGLGGAGNLGSTYNSQTGLTGGLLDANGIGAQTSAIQGLQGIAGQQGQTVGQLQNIANGVGPNPALAMFHQATSNNIQNQAAMMASQRGAGQNIGLMAKLAAQQGANTQQQASQQAATLQAQQQLGALGQIGAQQQAMGNTQQAIGALGSGLTGAAQTGITQQSQIANSQIGNELGATTALGTMGNQMVGQDIGAADDLSKNTLANDATLQQGGANFNNASVNNQGSVNSANAGTNKQAVENQGNVVGGVLNSLGVGVARGAAGGVVQAPMAMPMQSNGPQSSFGQFLSQPRGNVMPMARGGLATSGGNVKANGSAQKAVSPGNSYRNDKIPALLSEGEIVLPLSITKSKDPVKNSAKFVRAILAKRGRKYA